VVGEEGEEIEACFGEEVFVCRGKPFVGGSVQELLTVDGNVEC